MIYLTIFVQCPLVYFLEFVGGGCSRLIFNLCLLCEYSELVTFDLSPLTCYSRTGNVNIGLITYD